MEKKESLDAVFLKTYNTEFYESIITFTDQNGTLLEKENKANLTLLISKSKWHVFRAYQCDNIL